MADDWKCARCGGGSFEHSRSDSTCIWEPVPTEPTVQVPVSLVNDAAYSAYQAGADVTGDRLRALLSQPTPSAEPDRVFRCDDCGDEFDDDHYGDAQVHADQHGHNVPSWTTPSWDTPAAPPRIEDMAPGTTFTVRLLYSDTRYECKIGHGGVLAFRVWSPEFQPNHIDPSTIRDVTPPREDS